MVSGSWPEGVPSLQCRSSLWPTQTISARLKNWSLLSPALSLFLGESQLVSTGFLVRSASVDNSCLVSVPLRDRYVTCHDCLFALWSRTPHKTGLSFGIRDLKAPEIVENVQGVPMIVWMHL